MSESITQRPSKEPASKARKLSQYSWIVLAIVFLIVAGTIYSRRRESRQLEQRLRERAREQQRAEDQRVVEMLGGNRFEILMFYAAPPLIHRGESLQLCYGVSNAKSVRLEPQKNAVWPSASRCVYVSPVKDTIYTLTIEDGSGHTKSAAVPVQVR